MICDQVFRYYEAQGTTSRSRIPNFLKQKGVGDVIPIDRCYIECSNGSFTIETTDEDALIAVTKNGPSMTKQKGFVFIYQNDFKS